MTSASLMSVTAPLLLVLVGGLAALGAEPFLRRTAKHAWLPWIAAFFLVLAGLVQAFAVPGQLHGILAVDTPRLWLSMAVIGATLVSLGGLQQTLSRDGYQGGEPYALTMFAAAGVLVMVLAADLLALFVGLEIASLSVYALVGLRRHNLESNEGLFKYFVMGAVFSAIFLYGAALTYGATGSTHFGQVALAGRQPLLIAGATLMAIGLLFKVGAVPFHFWSPDAYTGAPVAVTGFMGAVIKVGGFAALGAIWLNLAAALSSGASVVGVLPLDAVVNLSAEAAKVLHPLSVVFLVAGLASIIIGNLSALRQTAARRIVAFSSVAHAGYMLMALVIADDGGRLALGSLWYYLAGYAVATAGALTALAALSGANDEGDDLHHLAGQGRISPFHGLVLTVFIASFAGLPPTVGFLGKFLVFADLVAKDQLLVAIAAMIFAVIGAAYYLRLLVAIWAPKDKIPAVTAPDLLARWGLAAAAVTVVVLVAASDHLTRPGQSAGAPAVPAHAVK